MKSVVDQQYVDVKEGKALDGPGPPGDREAKLKMHIKTVLSASDAMISLEQRQAEENSSKFKLDVQDILLPYLDSLYGSSIDAEDHSIFTKLTTEFENRFMQDMRDLNVLDPDAVTTVTLYVNQIVDYLQKI